MSDSGTDGGTMEEEKSLEFEWSAFYDDEGRIYYCNEKSGESSWDEPAHFNPPPDDGTENKSIEEVETTAGDNDLGDTREANQSNWVTYHNDEGREYYYNIVTEETTWEKPSRFEKQSEQFPIGPSLTTTRRLDQGTRDQVLEKNAGGEPEGRHLVQDDVESKMQIDETEVEPAQTTVDTQKLAEQALNRPDAILEPGIMTHVTEIVSRDNMKKESVIHALSKSYSGTTAVCGLLSRWLADLKSVSAASDVVDTEKRSLKQTKAFRKSADDIREMAQDVMFNISREKFTNIGGDNILNLQKAEVVFLEKMMDSKRWRALLIDLSASNKDSAMLRYCLKTISKRGHHREIASRTDQSDHFAVFDAMLASELAAVGKIAVSISQKQDSTIPLEELVCGLRRTCTSTAYTYIFALEVSIAFH